MKLNRVYAAFLKFTFMSSLQVTLLQSDLYWENPEANRNHFEEMLQGLSSPQELVVLPEMFTTGFTVKAAGRAETMQGPTMQWMKTMAARYRIILCGSLIIEEDGMYYNRLIWMQPNGQYGYYDKRHLFRYAGEDVEFSSGTRRFIARVNGLRICCLICYDLRFPELYRAIGTVDCHIIPAAFTYTTGKSHWEILLRARAIENQCYVLASAQGGKHVNQRRTWGHSMLIDPWGDIQADLPEGEGFITGDLCKDKLNEVRSQLPALAHRKL